MQRQSLITAAYCTGSRTVGQEREREMGQTSRHVSDVKQVRTHLDNSTSLPG